MKLLKSFPNKWYDVFYLSIYVMLLAWALWYFRWSIKVGNGQFVQDCLYNFGGGFIRRGLSGEILFFLQDLGIPLAWSVYLSSLAAYAFLGYVVIKYFLKRGYGLNVLLMPFVLGSAVVYGFDAFRRDFIELSLLAIVLLAFSKLSVRWWIITGNVVMMFGIALHEATFFFTVPILVLITNLRVGNIYKSIFAWIPAILMFLACCLFKGSDEAYPLLIERAKEYAPQCFANGKVPYLLQFIIKDSRTVFQMHIKYNFSDINYFGPIPFPAFLLTIFYIGYAFYMTIAMLIAFTRRKMSSTESANLVKIIIVQFVCLVPMFTVLSCDIARVLFYWIMSSLLVWIIINKKEQPDMFKKAYNRFGDMVLRKVFARYVPGRLPLTLMMLCIGVSFFIRAPYFIMTSSIGYHIAYLIKKALEIIHLL